MFLCVCVCVCMYVRFWCVDIYRTYIYACERFRMYIHTHICRYIHMSRYQGCGERRNMVRVCLCMCIYIYIYIYIYTHTPCMYMYIYIYTYTYTHTHINRPESKPQVRKEAYNAEEIGRLQHRCIYIYIYIHTYMYIYIYIYMYIHIYTQARKQASGAERGIQC